jgi:hypothetical protein
MDISCCGDFITLIPSGWRWAMPPVMLLFLIVIFGVPIAQIVHRSGRSRWWTVIAFVPLLNVIALWVFAFSRWPQLDRSSS